MPDYSNGCLSGWHTVPRAGTFTPEIERQVVAENPLRHIARPEDVAEVITFLVSEQARYITGQVIRMT